MEPKHQKEKVRDEFTGHQIRIGIMGSAGGELETDVVSLCRNLGRAVAKYGLGVLSGTGGITSALGTLQTSLNKSTGSEIIYDTDPEQEATKLYISNKSPTYGVNRS